MDSALLAREFVAHDANPEVNPTCDSILDRLERAANQLNSVNVSAIYEELLTAARCKLQVGAQSLSASPPECVWTTAVAQRSSSPPER